MEIAADNCIETESNNPFLKIFKRKRIIYIDVYNKSDKTYIGDSVLKQSAVQLMRRHTYFTGLTEGKYIFIIRFATVRETDTWELNAMLGGIFHESEKLGIKTYESSCKKIIRRLGSIKPQSEKELRKSFPLQ